jgi:regulator of RNase E activity RraA
MSTAVRQKGCTGAVIDGGVRDVDYLNRLGFPVFAKFKCAASSIGRWEIVAWQIPIHIGSTIVHPGDFVFGDTDGVVVVPASLTLEVLREAEDMAEREGRMREEIRAGTSVTKAYAKYGSL